MKTEKEIKAEIRKCEKIITDQVKKDPVLAVVSSAVLLPRIIALQWVIDQEED